MPQLVPFFFVNQVVFAFAILTILIYTFSKYILPKFVRIFISRIYINKLQYNLELLFKIYNIIIKFKNKNIKNV